MILENLVLVLGLIALGSLMKRSGAFPENTSDVLNKFVLYIALPAIILVNIPKATLNSDMIIPIAVHWSFLILHIVILFILYKWLKFSKSVLGALIIVSTVGNTAFLGIPMVKGFLGSQAIPYAVLYDQMGSGITFILYGAFVLPLFTGEKKKTSKEVLIKLFTFPAFLALLGGFVLKFLPLPFIFNNFLLNISGTLVPCAMLAVGFQMKYRFGYSTMKPLALGLWLKLIMMPLIVLMTLKLLGINNLASQVSVLQSGMPPMITAGAMAVSADLESELSVSLVGYGLIISFISLSLLRFAM